MVLLLRVFLVYLLAVFLPRYVQTSLWPRVTGVGLKRVEGPND